LEKLARDKRYLDFIRGQDCIITGRQEGIEAHHVTVFSSRGIGQKPSDYWCVPLHSEEHAELHQEGEKGYWTRKGIDPHLLACAYLHIYLVENLEEGEGLSLLRVLNDFAAERF
jgi:hypothetical protein